MIINDNRELLPITFKKYLLKLKILNYLRNEGIITEEIYNLSIVQIQK